MRLHTSLVASSELIPVLCPVAMIKFVTPSSIMITHAPAVQHGAGTADDDNDGVDDADVGSLCPMT